MSTEPTQTISIHGEPKLLYRCVCGTAFLVKPDVGGNCPDCQRVLPPDAMRGVMAATVSLSSLHEEHHLELHPEPTAEDHFIGRRLGHFLLERRIGEGGMGVVYRALDTSLQRYVAVKVLRKLPSGSKGKTSLGQLLQEAVAQARLNHPNVVTIYYVGKEEDEPFLAMELVPGQTVAQQVSEQVLPFHAIVSLTQQVIDALRHASLFGLVHGDIKPSNLLIAGPSQIKLSDFGLSRPQEDGGDGRSVSGTPNYLAPELLDGAPLSIQSDMYALGVTLFETTFQRLPFELQGQTLTERLSVHRSAVIEFPNPWPNDVPIAWRGFIERLLAKKPEDRFASYDQMADELQKLMPVSISIAGFANRVSAWVLDMGILLMLAFPMLIWSAVAINSTLIPVYIRWTGWVTTVLMLVLPFLHAGLVGTGRRTMGRLLFQLRVVDQHGLPLERRSLMLRELVRCLPFILLTWGNAANLGMDEDSFMFTSFTRLLVVLFVLLDIGAMLVMRDGQSLHDYLFQSSVVLDFTGSRLPAAAKSKSISAREKQNSTRRTKVATVPTSKSKSTKSA